MLSNLMRRRVSARERVILANSYNLISFEGLLPFVRRIFGGRDYAAIWSVVITCSSVASFLATPVWGMVFDIFGSYLPALIVMPVMLAVSIACLLGAFKK